MYPGVERLLRLSHVLRDFVGRDLQAKYVGSAGGVAWAVLHPLVLLLAYTFVFSVILRVRFGESGSMTAFALYLYCGMLPWHAFADAAARSTPCLVQHRNLIKNARFPAKILPATVALSELVSQGIGLVVLAAAAWALGHAPRWALLLLPLLVTVQLAFTLGVSMGLATINVFFRDVEQLVRVILLVWQEESRIRAADHRGAASGGPRWGDGRIEVREVRSLDASGAERHVFVPGEALVVEARFRVKADVERPVFGVGVFRSDGTYLCGVNHLWHEQPLEIGPLRGGETGRVRCTIDPLPLLKGTYYLSYFCYDHSEAVPVALDHQERVKLFQVVEGAVEMHGTVALSTRWEVER